ncbi:MAG TPA: hypothetical protein VM889_04395 [Candidatus Thermoplasmatota archaeon]|nr:hypothetical protein [Candidatus Thermoplasmatota archaeon]
MAELDLPGLIDAGSGLLLLALGAFVASVKPRRRENLAFAAMSVSMGLVFVFFNLFNPDDPRWNYVDLLGRVMVLPFAAAIVMLALWVPRPLAREERTLLVIPILAGLGRTAFGAAQWVPTWTEASPGYFVPGIVRPLAVDLMQGALVFALLLFALRAGRATSPEDRRQEALMSRALLLYPAFYAGMFLVYPGGGPLGIVATAPFVLVAAVWLANTARIPEPDSAVARNVALLALALPLLGLLTAVYGGGFEVAQENGSLGFMRGIAVAILAYAVVRSQLLGLDLKVRWTVKQSTVAGAFLGVFFVVSESAAAFFQGALGDYVGIVAAGALVFGLAPLQRLGDRIADRAVPLHASATGAAGRKREMYSNALALAWRDGTLSPVEMRHLLDVREMLGLTSEEAAEIEREWAEKAARLVRP